MSTFVDMYSIYLSLYLYIYCIGIYIYIYTLYVDLAPGVVLRLWPSVLGIRLKASTSWLQSMARHAQRPSPGIPTLSKGIKRAGKTGAAPA